MQANSIAQTMLFFFLLSFAAYTDIKRREIPDALCVLMVMVALLNFRAINTLGILVALPFLIAAMISPSGMGGGDIKLTASVGLVLGLWKTLIGVTIGLFTVIMIHGVRLLILKNMNKGTKPKSYPLAPFLAIGLICAYLL